MLRRLCRWGFYATFFGLVMWGTLWQYESMKADGEPMPMGPLFFMWSLIILFGFSVLAALLRGAKRLAMKTSSALEDRQEVLPPEPGYRTRQQQAPYRPTE